MFHISLIRSEHAWPNVLVMKTDLEFSFINKGLRTCSIEQYIIIYYLGINNNVSLLAFLCLSCLIYKTGLIHIATVGH